MWKPYSNGASNSTKFVQGKREWENYRQVDEITRVCVWGREIEKVCVRERDRVRERGDERWSECFVPNVSVSSEVSKAADREGET